MDTDRCEMYDMLFKMQFAGSVYSIKHVALIPLTIYGYNTPTPYPYLIWGKWMKKYVSPKYVSLL